MLPTKRVQSRAVIRTLLICVFLTIVWRVAVIALWGPTSRTPAMNDFRGSDLLREHHLEHISHPRHLHGASRVEEVVPTVKSTKRHVTLPPTAAVAALLQTVQSFLFEEEPLWNSGTPRNAPSSPPGGSQIPTVACELEDDASTSLCLRGFRMVSRAQGRMFHVVAQEPGQLGRTASPAARRTSASPDPRRAARSSLFLSGPTEVLRRLPAHAKKMESVATERLRLTGKPLLNETALIARLVGGDGSSDPCGMPEGATQRAEVPTVRLLSAKRLARSLRGGSPLRSVLFSAEYLIVVLDETGVVGDSAGSNALGDNDGDRSFALEAIALALGDAQGALNCSFTALHDVEERFDHPLAAVVRCQPQRQPREPSPGCAASATKIQAEGRVAVPRLSGASFQPLCQDLPPGSLTLLSAIKWGTKTAIFMGRYNGVDVAVKMFHVQQYATFVGFLDMMRSSLRSPYINYPSASCLDATTSAVYQVQPFLGRGSNLLQFLKRSGKTLTWKDRLELAVPLLCMFRHLHESHPRGFFTFDDNHPEQYFVEEVLSAGSTEANAGGPTASAVVSSAKRVRLSLKMVDIDTMQKAVSSDGVADGSSRKVVPPELLRIQCRCFYCHGKSDCVFLNSAKGYAACGQFAGEHEDKEVLSAIREEVPCDGNNDAWFVAQLLYLIGKGSVAWGGVGHAEVVRRLANGQVPVLKSSDAEYDAVVNEIFTNGSSLRGALPRVVRLCLKHGCVLDRGVEDSGCQADYRVDDHPYTSPLLEEHDVPFSES